MAQDESFELGDQVRLVNMNDSEMNGLIGKLVKTVGKGRFALMLDGKDKSTVVNTKNLERCVETSETPKSYDIVGTWDDWEPHPMKWNSGLNCFEYTVTLGSDGVESFKFLVEGDWDTCVYPGHKDASLHDGHKVCGPDDGGLDAEWTIGLHQMDHASPGETYRVCVFLSCGVPFSVKWENLKQESSQMPAKQVAPKVQLQAQEEEEIKPYRPSKRIGWKEQFSAEPAAKEKPYSREENVFESRYDQAAFRDDDDHYPPRGNHGKARNLDERGPFDAKVEETEKAARERLARRLEMAAEAEMKMITDEGLEGTIQPVEREQAALNSKLAENRRRYIAHSGARKDRETLQSGSVLEASAEKDGSAAERTDGGANTKTADITRLQGECMECKAMTENILDVGGYCCPICWQLYQSVMADGWNSCVLIEGKQAAQHAQRLVDQKGQSLTISMARREILNKYPDAFRNGGSNSRPYHVSVRQCSECGRATTDGVQGTGDLWFCKACRRQ
uniref:AMP-activated protein kinase glycogen-binding domain-containing protein n=1 Tax=Alexandrium catenella TaxID=2925 RepID=A0A7S1LTV7_ALECA